MPPSRRRNQKNEGRTTPDRFARAMRRSIESGRRAATGPGQAAGPTAEAASCPQAASISAPLVMRMVAFTPRASSWSRNLADALSRGADHRIARRGVERDEVDVGAQRAGERRQLGRVAVPVVDAVDHGPLDGEAAAAGRHVVGTGSGQYVERIAAVDGHELVAQRVVGGVERDGEVHGQGLGGQAADAGHDAHRGEGEVAGREAHVAVQPFDRAPDPVVVGERLPHPHEHDVGDPPGRAARMATDLLDDLARVRWR